MVDIQYSSGSSELVKTHMVMVEIRRVVLTRSHKLREISWNLVGFLKNVVS